MDNTSFSFRDLLVEAALSPTQRVETGGSDRDLFLDRSSEADTFNGRAGDDHYIVEGNWGVGNVFNGGQGADLLNAHGIALLPFQYTTTTLGNGSFSVSGQGQSVRLRSVEDFFGSNYMDLVYGSEAANRVLGLKGDDTFHDANGGTDSFYGGSGRDTYRVHDGIGTDNHFYGEGGIDTLDLSGFTTRNGEHTSTSLNDHFFRASETGAWIALDSVENVVGSDGNDFVYGSTSNNRVQGGQGTDHFYDRYDSADVFEGQEGDDHYRYFVDAGEGNTFDGGGGSDTFDSSDPLLHGGFTTNTVLGDGSFEVMSTVRGGDVSLISVENFMGSDAMDHVLGTAGANRIKGAAGNDILDGNGGVDTLLGGDGNDRIFAGDASDGMIVDGGAGDDRVYVQSLGSGAMVHGGNGNDTIIAEVAFQPDTVWDLLKGTRTDSDTSADWSGFENFVGEINLVSHETVYGTHGANRISGSGGDNLIVGRRGADSLFGNDGNDTLKGGIARDQLWGGNGNDDVRGGKGADLIYGENGEDDLRGGYGADTIFGGAGADEIRAGSGADEVNGGSGNDLLSGGKGADVFVFSGNWGADHLVDFEVGRDTLLFEGVQSASELTLSNVNGADVLATHAASGSSVLINDLSAAELQTVVDLTFG